MKFDDDIKKTLSSKGLKATIQRLAVYEALKQLNNHPSAEMISEYIKKQYPTIAVGTIYKTLEVLAENKIIKRVKNEGEMMRYDANLCEHHHLYDEENKTITDFEDKELSEIINKYFKDKKIPNFQIEDLKLHIVGKFQHNE